MKFLIKRLVAVTISLMLIILNITSIFGAKSITDLNKEKQEIKNKTNSAQSSLNQTQAQKKSVLEQVEALDKQLTIVQDELTKLNTQLVNTQSDLDKNELALADARQKKENQYETLKYRMRVMYETGSIGYLQVILEADGFTDMLRRIEYINKISEYDSNVFDEYQKTENTINEKVEEIKVQKTNIETLAKQQQAKKADLDTRIKEKETLVAQLSKDEASYLQQLSDLDKADKDITNLILKAEAEAKAKAEAEARAKANAAKNSSSSSSGSSSNKVYATTSGTLQYPVPAYRGYNYNSPYGYRSSPISGKSEFHTGVDLKATMGTDIVAAESGTVIFAGNKGGYGKTVIIDHGNGMSTLYAHNSQLVVSAGQTVQRGQVVSKAGTTGYSTGVHLHFEVRLNGKHTNPAPYIGH